MEIIPGMDLMRGECVCAVHSRLPIGRISRMTRRQLLSYG